MNYELYHTASDAEEKCLRQIRFGLISLARLRGYPEHIGCGLREGDNGYVDSILIVYFTNAKKKPDGIDELMIKSVTGRCCFLWTTITKGMCNKFGSKPRWWAKRLFSREAI